MADPGGQTRVRSYMEKIMEFCSPKGHAGTYKGWHLKRLRVYGSMHEAEEAARRISGKAFYCEFGRCWHIGR